MVVARCTLSDSSELFRSLLLAVCLTAAAPLRADRWSEGRFPIPVFEGYTSHFGMRRAADGTLRPHNGLDIAAPLGSPVLSWWHGRVIETIDDDSCGVGVVIASGKYHHIYCHLRRQRLRRDQWVSAGQVIGQVGLTGRTTGAHLHWGIRHSGRWLDPAQILRAMIRGRRAIVPVGP